MMTLKLSSFNMNQWLFTTHWVSHWTLRQRVEGDSNDNMGSLIYISSSREEGEWRVDNGHSTSWIMQHNTDVIPSLSLADMNTSRAFQARRCGIQIRMCRKTVSIWTFGRPPRLVCGMRRFTRTKSMAIISTTTTTITSMNMTRRVYRCWSGSMEAATCNVTATIHTVTSC